MMFQCVSLMPEMPFDPIAILLKKDIGGHVPDIGLHTLTYVMLAVFGAYDYIQDFRNRH